MDFIAICALWNVLLQVLTFFIHYVFAFLCFCDIFATLI